MSSSSAKAGLQAVWIITALALTAACGSDDDSTDSGADASDASTADGADVGDSPDANEDTGGDASRPDASEPDSGAPDASEPDSGAPDASEPDATALDGGESDADADTGRPDADEPDAGEPDVGDAGMDAAEDAAPDVMEPPVDTALACRLRETRVFRDGIGVGFPIEAERMASRGTVRVQVILVDFSDVPATRTPTEAFGLVSPGAEEFFSAVSYGALNLELRANMSWLRLSQNAAHYGAALTSGPQFRAFIEEAIALADPDVDFSDTDVIVVLANPDAEELPFGPTYVGLSGDGFVVDGNNVTNAITSGHDLLSWGHTWLNHELGHAMGLPDLYDDLGVTGYTRPFSLMDLIAGEAPGHLAWERFQLGWLTSEQVACNVMDEEIVLSPLATSGGGTKAAMVAVSATRIIVAESRRATGVDSGLTEAGVVVSTVDMTTPFLMGPIRVLNDQSALSVGESVSSDGVRVDFESSDASGDTIRITSE